MGNGHFVKLERFEGPLDLLLLLIRQHELDIFQIDLVLLTNQYLSHLRLIAFRDLTEAADFVAMAATLVEVKSRRLLPQSPLAQTQDPSLEEDSAQSIEHRLIAYDTFRQAALALGKAAQGAPSIRSSLEYKRLEPSFSHGERPLRADPAGLVILYEQLLAELADRRPARVTAVTESITLEQVLIKLKSLVDQTQVLLLQKLYGSFQSRYELVAYLIGALQLVRDQVLNLHQEELQGPIWLYDRTLTQNQLADLTSKGSLNP